MRIVNITQGLTVRLLFTVASIIAVWQVVTTTQNNLYWLLLFFNVVLYVEAVVTFTKRKSGEWKWMRLPNTIPPPPTPKQEKAQPVRFCPSVMIYLLMAVPCTWTMEIHLLIQRLEVSRGPNSTNISDCAATEDISQDAVELDDVSVQGVKINIPLSLQPHMWALALQQILLFVLIIGRWMLPKGDLTRDQLSQLLLVYIGIAADILEFCTEGLKMKETRCNILMVVWILAIWTWSLLQFTLGLTVTKSRKGRVASSRDMEPRMNIMCCETEVWGILATVVMQDGPFLALRLYVLVVYDAINQMMIFFTCKNMLVVLLQFYRLVVVFVEKPGRDPNSIMGRIHRFRHPDLRYHSGGGSMNGSLHRGMPSERDASTAKLLSLVEAEASNGHIANILPLLPADLFTADGRLRHSINMSNDNEMHAHTPQYPERFPDTAFVIGKTLGNDIPVVQMPDELDSVDSFRARTESDYENPHTPKNGDAEYNFAIPDFTTLPSVYDSDEYLARRAELERLEQYQEEDETDKKDKKKSKEDKKKEKEELKKQKEELKKQKEEQKKKEKEAKKIEKEEKKKEKEEKKMEEKQAKKDRRASLQRRGSMASISSFGSFGSLTSLSSIGKDEKRKSRKESKKKKGDAKSDGEKMAPLREDDGDEDRMSETSSIFGSLTSLSSIGNDEKRKSRKESKKKKGDAKSDGEKMAPLREDDGDEDRMSETSSIFGSLTSLSSIGNDEKRKSRKESKKKKGDAKSEGEKMAPLREDDGDEDRMSETSSIGSLTSLSSIGNDEKRKSRKEGKKKKGDAKSDGEKMAPLPEDDGNEDHFPDESRKDKDQKEQNTIEKSADQIGAVDDAQEAQEIDSAPEVQQPAPDVPAAVEEKTPSPEQDPLPANTAAEDANSPPKSPSKSTDLASSDDK